MPARTNLANTAALTALALALTGPAAGEGGKGTILDLQEHRREETVLDAHLINLNPAVNAWYLLELTNPGGPPQVFNLENAHPGEQRLHLRDKPPGSPGRLVINDYLGSKGCDLWDATGGALRAAAATHKPFVPLCDGRLFLRNPAVGGRSAKEVAVDFLRDHVWGGEGLTSFVKDRFFKDKYRLAAQESGGDGDERPDTGATGGDTGPRPAAVAADHPLAPRQLGIAFGAAAAGTLDAGTWYGARNQAGVFISEVSPSRVAPAVMSSFPGAVSRLDSTEANASVYLVAFDLSRFGVGFALGTDHPRVDWSPRVPTASREPGAAGPDGFATVAPLVKSGMLNPAFRSQVVATFAGGFKRSHGAFRWGELAQKNGGSHYGFIEDGVTFSRLQPGLATLFVKADGSFGMKTWTEADQASVPELRYARQNGVALIEHSGPGSGRPGPFVADWAKGNWSGSVERKLRTLRSGLCLQRDGQRRFLIYAYFSTATPNAMARVFQAYGCEYAMHLDMNAPEHTYMALYHEARKGLAVEHLVRSMATYDGKDGQKVLPRFVAVPDNRDFVFLYKRPSDL